MSSSGRFGGSVDLADLPIERQLWENAGVAAFSNTAAETSLVDGTVFSIPANFLEVGDRLLLWCSGTYINNSGAGRDLTLRHKTGATVLGSYVTSIAGNVVVQSTLSRPFFCWTRLRVASVGAGGTLRAQAWGEVGQAGTGIAFPNATALRGLGWGDVAVDTTAPIPIDMTAQMSAATATQTVTPRDLTIAIVRGV